MTPTRIAVLGDRARDDRLWREAAGHYRASLKMDPSNAAIHVQLGHMLKEMGDLKAAEEAYRAALALGPMHSDTWLMLGHCLKSQHRKAESVEAYVAAYNLDPSSVDALRELVLAEAAERISRSNHVDNGRLQRWVADIGTLRETLDRLERDLPSLASFASFHPANYDLFRKVHRLPAPGHCVVHIQLVVDLAGWSTASFRRFLDSLAGQTHDAWSLAVLDGSSTEDEALRQLVALASAAEPRIVLTAASPGPDDLILALKPHTMLDENALAWLGWAAGHSGACAFLFDEDRMDASDGHMLGRIGSMYDPLAARNDPASLGDMIAVRAASLAGLTMAFPTPGMPLTQDLLEALAATGGVGHVPLPLATRMAQTDVTQETGRAPRGGEGEDSALGISVIVPTRDRLDLLRPCLDSLWATAQSPAAVEVIVVDNGSQEPATRDYLAAAEAKGELRTVRIDEPFNWARLNNLAVRSARNPLLLFLNNDTEFVGRDWDRILRATLSDARIGAVGARLLYADRTIQHAGILFGFEHLTLHDGRHRPAGTLDLGGRWARLRCASAVTGACLAIGRDLFESLGGFDERSFAISYNDVDLCLRVREAGLLVAYQPELVLFHHESKSRGLDADDPSKRERDQAEAARLRRRWGSAILNEPSAGPFWARFAPPFSAIAMPSAERVMDYIVRSARPNPWSVERDRT